MQVADFSIGLPLLGGALIGLAATTLLAFHGRIAGISGIFAGLVRPKTGDTGWRVTFFAGLLTGGLLLLWLHPGAFSAGHPRTWPWLLAAGLLVGFGTRVGGGCTSGHGVCGLSHRSPRSLVAVVVFVLTGMLTVLLLRQGFSLEMTSLSAAVNWAEVRP